MAPEAAGREKKVEMRQPAERKRRPVECEAGLEKGQVKRFPVERDQRTEIRPGEEPSEFKDHVFLFGQFAQKELEQMELPFPVVSEANEKGNDSRAAGEPGRLEVEKKCRGQVLLGKSGVPAQERQDFAADRQAGGKRDPPVFRLKTKMVLEDLVGRFRQWLGTGRFGLPPLLRPSQAEQPFQLLLSGDIAPLFHLPPGLSDRVRSRPGRPLLFPEPKPVFNIHVSLNPFPS